MTSQTSRNAGWRVAVTSVVASGALAAGLMAGLGAAPAWAEPTTEAPTPEEATAQPAMSADQALAIIATEYDTGAGGGKVSVLIHKVLKLRQAGYRPSQSNGEALVEALDERPNQVPLVQALEATLANQLKQQARGQAPAQNPAIFGINQLPPGQPADPTNPDNTGVIIGGPGFNSNLPIG